VRKKGIVLEDEADAAAIWRFCGDITAVEENLSAGGFLEAGVQLSLPAWRW